MRVVKEWLRPECKITVFQWNNRYIVKLEHGFLEQTYKISELDLTGEDQLLQLLDDQFFAEAIAHFQAMGKTLFEAVQRS